MHRRQMKLANSNTRVEININIKSIKNSENQLLFAKVIISQSKVIPIYKNRERYSY